MKSFLSLLLAFFIQLSAISGAVSSVPSDASAENSPYKGSDIVSVIVELDKSPLLDGVKNVAQKNKLLKNFAESDAYKSLISFQNSVKATIQKKIKKADFSSSYSYSFVFDGFSLSLPYKYIDKLKSIDGVSDVSISTKYDQCESVDADRLREAVKAKSAMADEGEFTGVNNAHEKGYTGKGLVVAVLDSSFELGHEAFSPDIESPKLSKKDINLITTFKCLNTIIPMYSHYINEKIPYRWDYSEVNKGVFSPNSDHGTHVAGIIGGNSETLTGVAPDCQLLLMKVFGDAANSKAESYVTLAALDDAVKLGADVCNLSLSSPSGQEPDDPFTSAVFRRLARAGINVVCSAGNEASMGYYDATSGSDTVNADLFDYGTVGSPSTYSSSMSIAASQIYSRTSIYDDTVNVSGVGSQMMASYSGWGVSADLRLKPEITAPGSNIYSSVSENGYDYMSGTSMSSPYYAGCYSLLRQYVNEKFPSIQKKQSAEFINSILMSTATMFRGYGTNAVYSPRRQGAGLVNLDGALATKAYLTSANGGRPKIELGEDTDGTLDMSFSVNNMSDETLSYKLSPVVLAETYALKNGVYVNNLWATRLTGSKYSVEYVSGADENGNVTVDPKSKTDVSVKITFSPEFIENQKKAFSNGFFLDGFLVLKSSDEPTLSLPYVAFYGDWDKDMLFDYSMYSGTPSYLGRQWGLYVTDGKDYYPLGANLFEDEKEYDIDEKYCAYSKNALKSEMEKPYVTACVGLLRNGKRVDFNLFTESGVFRYCGSTLLEYERKTNYPYSPVTGLLWGGKSGLVNGQSYVYKVSTRAANYKSGRETVSYKFTVDNDAPLIENCEYKLVDGKYILKLTLSDNRYIMGFRVLTEDDSTVGDVSFKGIEPVNGKYEYELDVSALAGRWFSSSKLETIKLYVLDYAYNEAFATVKAESGEIDGSSFDASAVVASARQSFIPADEVVETGDAEAAVNYGMFDKIIKKLQRMIEA